MPSKNNDKQSLNINSIQQFDLAILIINRDIGLNLEYDFSRDLRTAVRELDNIIKKGNNNISEIYETTNKKIKENLLTNEEIEAHFSNDRFCNFCWSLIYSLEKSDKRYIGSETLEEKNITESIMECMLFTKTNDSCINIKQRKMDIINKLQHSNSFLNEKIETIAYLNKLWIESYERGFNLNWLDKNNESDCKWCYDYMINSGYTIETFTPTENDYYWSTLSSIDLTADKDKVELLIMKMKKTFSQRKYREKHPELKSYSIKMTKETKEKLDEIVKIKDAKIHKIIEDLIEREHRSVV